MLSYFKNFLLLFLAATLLALGLAPQDYAKQKKKIAKTNLAVCLPLDVKLSEVIVHGLNGAKDHTVQDALKELKARCVKGKLIAPNKREVRFFRPSCWGNPPIDAQEIQAAETRQLQELKKRYQVVTFQCNPMIQ